VAPVTDALRDAIVLHPACAAAKDDLPALERVCRVQKGHGCAARAESAVAARPAERLLTKSITYALQGGNKKAELMRLRFDNLIFTT
jgi:hypothetical protein